MLKRTARVIAELESNPEAEKVMKAFGAVLETDPGKILFAHLFYLAGYDKADHVAGHEHNEQAAEFNMIRRSFYVAVRKRVPKTHRKTLLEVELLAEDGFGSGLPKPADKKAETPE